MHHGLRPNQQTGTGYTIALSDANERMVECNNTDPFTLTVPANANAPFADGDVVRLAQVGEGQVTVSADMGVNLIVIDGFSSALAGQGAVAILYKQAIDTWILAGDLATGSVIVDPSVELTDDFNRANQAGLGTSAEGWSWATMHPTFAIEGEILNNWCYIPTSEVGFWRAEQDLSSEDMFSELQALSYHGTGGGDTELYAACRVHPSQITCYLGRFTWLRGTDQDEYQLQKRINNVQTNIGAPFLEPHSTYPTTVRLEVVGDQLTLKGNGVTKVTGTDSEITGYVRAGFGIGSGLSHSYDNFQAGVL